MSYPPPSGYPGYPPQGYPDPNAQFTGYAPQGYPPPTTPYTAQGYPQAQGYPPQGYPPQGYPPQQFPPQQYPPQQYPPQQYPQQGYPPQGYPPQQGAPPQQYPQQGYPPQGYPQQGVPPQQYPQQGVPPQQFPQQGYPQTGAPQQFPQQGAPQQFPQQGAPQQFPQQGLPQQGVPTGGNIQQVPNAQIYLSNQTPPPQPYNGEPDAEALYKAMKGLGTDDKVLSNILSTRTRDQVLEIRKAFERKYSKSLASWIKGETSGHYEEICLALIENPAEYDAKLVKEAVKGLGTDDHQLIETICTRNNQELKAMREAYTRLFSVDIEKDVVGDTSGHYRDLLVAVLRADRPESTTVDIDAAKRDAQTLYNAGEGKIGTDEKVFIDILSHRTFPHLHVVAQQYAITTGHSLERGIAKETSFNFKKAMTILITPRDEYFADEIHDAIAGAGTKDHKLVRIIGYLSKSKELIKAVNNYYTHKYKHNLANDVGGDTSGWYKKTMLAVIQNRVAL